MTNKNTSPTGSDAGGSPDSAAPDGSDANAAAASETLPTATPEMVAGARPRIRSGAIVWGLLVSATAVLVLAIVGSPTNNAAFGAWAGRLGIGGAILVAVIALGAFILLMALLSIIRNQQRRRAAR